MIGQSMHELSDDVCRRWCNEKTVRSIRQFDVAGAPVFFFIEETRHHRVFGKGLQGEWRNELRCVVRHDHKNVMTLFHEQTRQLGGLVSGDRAGDAENNRFAGAAQAHNLACSSFFWSPVGIFAHGRIDNYFWIKRRLKYRSALLMCRNFCKSSSVVSLMIM